jgi:radical SAM superfamily enzyme YgiQ (UPF0313 family)
VDLNVRPLTDADLAWADVVLFGAMISQGPSLQEQLARCKARGLPTVVGGPITSSKQPAFAEADHVVEGEAEELIPRLCADLEAGAAEHKYSSPQFPDVTKVPIPHFDLVDVRRDYNLMMVQYSRGCPFTCEFCDIIEIYGRRPRTKTPEQMLAELDAIFRLGFRGRVFFVDDNFIGNKKNTKALMPHLVKWMHDHNFPFSLMTEASLNLADDKELLALMRDAHFNMVFLGIESPVEESLKETTKYQNLTKDMLSRVRLIQSYGMEVTAGFIVGFDSDPPDVFDRHIQFIREASIPFCIINVLQALPKTQLERRLAAEGRLLGVIDPRDGLNFVPRMDTRLLREGHGRIRRTIYHPREYFQRVSTFVSRIETSASSHLSWSDVMVLGRSLWHQGLHSHYCREYCKFLAKSLRRHPSQFKRAVSLAIIGHDMIEEALVPRETIAD